ncbi:MAG: ribosome-inactivating family protein [Bryobacteraceae bacterium]
MPEIEVTVDLNAGRYQTSLQALRSFLEAARGKKPFLFAALLTPAGDTIDIQIRTQNLYVVAFHGADGWYYFDDEPGALGKPAGTGSNYNQLGHVGNIAYDDLRGLGELSRFRKGQKLDKRLVAILIALTSEAARFATVSTYFTGLTNSVGTQYAAWLQGGVNFEYLKNHYFNNWTNPPDPPMVPGQVYHPVKPDILLPNR